MAWQATVESVVSEEDPRGLTKVVVGYTDGNRYYHKSYQANITSAVTDVQSHILDELNLLGYRDTNSISVSSYSGLVLAVSSGRLVTVPSSSVIIPSSATIPSS